MSRPVALITGGSSGIGFELAACFAGGGHDLILVARRAAGLAAASARLASSGAVHVTTIPADLGIRSDVDRVLATLDASGTMPHVLVNNAGFGLVGAFSGGDADTLLDMIAVNVAAPTQLMRALLPGMLARGSGRILNVASTAAFQPGPFVAVYYATKAYLLSLSDAVAEELAGTGVTVTTLCPGPTPTGFAARAHMQISRLLAGASLDAASVARAGYDGTMRGERLVVPGALNKLISSGVRFVPRGLVTRIGRRLNADRSALS